MNTAQDNSGTEDLRRALQELGKRLVGSVIEPQDPLYDEARAVWNGMIDRRPRAVIRAGAVQDIAPVLEVARNTGLALAVRGGGHSIAGHGTVEDGLVLDLGVLRSVEVDVERRLVTVAPGARLSDVDRATTAHGLVVPLGEVSMTGVAGLTLGGGVGWLTRTHGLSLDNLVAADLVTARGEHLHASEQENPELFWGLRGGGGNFGVVSSFTFRAHPLPAEVLCANLFYRPARWRDALRAFDRWAQELPEEMNAGITFIVLPPELGVGRQPWMVLGCVWASEDHDAGRGLIERLRSAVAPDAEETAPTSWTVWQSAMDEMLPPGSRSYLKNQPITGLDETAREVLVDVASDMTWFGTAINIYTMGGAFGRIPDDATAFPDRSAKYWVEITGFWTDPAEDQRLSAFARTAHARLQPFAAAGQYVNFIGEPLAGAEETAETARRAYGLVKYERLVALKNRYDPENLFRLNHNVIPVNAGTPS
ncbi:FAD-binding oxidoreductase [Citricoccus sp.]|uniref:FAD-binding oxidoreductase n=1 Tax=Citricoccus sp. TaxID=1978372 RepID=UPI00262AF3E6|nr:FAD-binding oxidoreductase [Citricoccus sp.]HRO31445.1 FAD-binding oxidoreductase [Citricoccus sp.]